MPPAPGTLRDHYVIGRTGSFFVPTVTRVDKELEGLRARLRGPLTAQQHACVWHDLDALLERRQSMTEP